MQTEDSQKVIGRFFDALAQLKSDKRIGGPTPFAEKYNINRRNLYKLEKNNEKDIFEVAWLSYLVRDYNVSAVWLLTGEGSFYSEPCKIPASKE
ncbi:hypothetical protein [Bacteroides fragilis]|uniref:hypothetical protein n=1 Tax=Bacteroides fragilis TaxID=817 RepID=UPI001C6FDFB6|nr:hypothetical protein [Bacteroides fragilis]MBW9276669.1 hypothetical protein [Bacteroides fragilis]